MNRMCKRMQHRPESLFSWLVCVCAAFCQAVNLGFAFSYGVLLPEVMKEFGESRQKTVWVGSLALGLTFFLGPLASFLCQTIGCRFTAILGCLLCGASLFLTAYSSGLQWMFLTYGCLYGLGSSLLFSSYFLITAKNFRRWQSFAVGIVSVGGSIGVLIIGPSLQLLIDEYSWRGAYRIISAPFIVMVFICGATFGDPISSDSFKTSPQNCTFNAGELAECAMEVGRINMNFTEDSTNSAVYRSRTSKINERENRDGIESLSAVAYQKARQMLFTAKSRQVVAKDDTNTDKSSGKLSKFLDFSVFAVPSYTVATLSLLLMNFSHFTPQIHLVKYCLDLGISADSASRLFILFGLSSSIARIATGRICDVTWVNTIYIYQFGVIVDGFAIVVLPVIRKYTAFQVFSVVYGLADGIFITTMNSLLMFSVDEERRAAGLGLGNTLLSLGIVAGSPFAVWVGSLAIGLTFFLGSLGSLLCQTIGCRFTSILGCLVCAMSLLVTPHSTSLEWMFLTYGCVFGIGSALMLSSYFLITAKNFRRWQSLAVGIVTVGGSSGLLIMGPLLQLLIDIFGWRGTYRILSIPFFVMACVCGVTFGDPLPDTSEDLSRNCKTNQCNSKLLSESEGHPEMEMNAIDKKQTTVNEERKVKIFESECQTEIQQRSQMRSSHAAAKTDGSKEANCLGKLNTLLDFSVFKIPCYTVAVLSLCLMKFGHFIPQIHMVNYCLELGISADSASRFFIPFGLLSSVARVVTGRICDVIWVNTTYIYQFGALLDGFAIVVLPVIRNYTGIQVFAVIYGIADGVLISTMNSLLMFSVDEKRRAAALGLGNSLLSLAIASGPPFAGFLIDVSDCYTWPFFIAGIVLHVAGLVPLVLFCLKEKTRKDDDLKNDKIRKPLL